MIHYIEPDQLSVVRCMQEDMAGRPPGRNRSSSNATPTPSDSPLIQHMAQAMTQMMEAQGREDRDIRVSIDMIHPFSLVEETP